MITLSFVEITLANMSVTLLIVTNEHRSLLGCVICIYDFCSSISLLLLEIDAVLIPKKELLRTATGDEQKEFYFQFLALLFPQFGLLLVTRWLLC